MSTKSEKSKFANKMTLEDSDRPSVMISNLLNYMLRIIKGVIKIQKELLN